MKNKLDSSLTIDIFLKDVLLQNTLPTPFCYVFVTDEDGQLLLSKLKSYWERKFQIVFSSDSFELQNQSLFPKKSNFWFNEAIEEVDLNLASSATDNFVVITSKKRAALCKNANKIVIEFKKKYYFSFYETIAEICSLNLGANKDKLNQECSKFAFDKIDNFCQFLILASFAGRSLSQFITLYSPIFLEKNIFDIERSLFEKNTKKFFTAWLHAKEDFDFLFWTAFLQNNAWKKLDQANLLEVKKLFNDLFLAEFWSKNYSNQILLEPAFFDFMLKKQGA